MLEKNLYLVQDYIDPPSHLYHTITLCKTTPITTKIGMGCANEQLPNTFLKESRKITFNLLPMQSSHFEATTLIGTAKTGATFNPMGTLRRCLQLKILSLENSLRVLERLPEKKNLMLSKMMMLLKLFYSRVSCVFLTTETATKNLLKK